MKPLAAAAFVLALAGCNPRVPTGPPDAPPVSLLSLSKDINHANGEWAAQLSKRFGPDVFVVSVHGASRNGELWLIPDQGRGVPLHAETLAQTLKLLYPTRPVILIACNEGGHRIRVSGVWYCPTPRAVWSSPGPDVRWYRGEFVDGAGDVDDFAEGHPTSRPSTRPTTRSSP